MKNIRITKRIDGNNNPIITVSCGDIINNEIIPPTIFFFYKINFIRNIILELYF